LAVVALWIGAGVVLWPALWPDVRTRLVRQATAAFAEHQYGEVEQLARAVLDQWPDDAAALVLAGRAAAKAVRDQQAKDYFLRVSDKSPEEYVAAQYGLAMLLYHEGRATAAEMCLRRALELDPLHVRANYRLAILLQSEGRTWEALPHAQAVIRCGRCGHDELLMIGALDSMMVDDPEWIDKCLQAVPDDPVVLLGRGQLALLRRDDAAEAESIFRRVVAKDPEQMEAQARLGEVLLQKPDPADFLRWNAALPRNAELHPRTWHARGLWAKRNGQPRAAVRCFLEALRLHPVHASSNFQLSQTLLALGQSEVAAPFIERSRLLAKVEYTMSQLRDLNDVELMRQMSEAHEEMGLPWDAIGWAHVAHMLAPDTAWARERLVRPNRSVDASWEFIPLASQPALAVDLSQYPEPTWPEPKPDSSVAGPSRPALDRVIDGDIRWVDDAAASGLNFQYFNGTTPAKGPDHIIQANGSGVGVVDFDGDLWPDLYFVQGGLYEQRGPSNPYTDRLFRNLGNGRFEDVTEQAGLGDRDYGQGVSVGDVNDDGFADIYVCNIGTSRLYQNMGDGTYLDVTDQAGVGGADVWSTSAAIVDLNNDGLPEIYAVNYVLLQEALARDCGRRGYSMSCAPTLFHFEQDRLYQNLGDGRFRDITDGSGIRVSDGKGLGIVATDFDGSGRINLLVGNDTTPNLYFVNQTSAPGTPPRFAERGLEYGLALNEAGQSQASMGITVGDANGDGLLDVYVGTFYQDSNTLFVQTPDHMFFDQSRAANLRDLTFNVLTFGAQFLDGDLDGWPDLIQANGHVERTYASDKPDLMLPQYLKNVGRGKFVELSGRSLGPYFQKSYLGRTVAVIDWNRDGKDDACITHLEVPVALLTNCTPATGHYLALRLCGVQSSRDGFGAIVEVSAGGRTWTRAMAAGGGYFASNERKLIFGLGPAQKIDHVQVRWPSGIKQTLENLDVDREWLVEEGMSAPLAVPK
jgi:tetratricopeptide (TPR) repeat protein